MSAIPSFPITILSNHATSIPATLPKEAKSSHDLGMTVKNHKRHIAQHHYHDHANEIVDVKQLNAMPKPKGGVAVPFPSKLHKILDEVEKDGLATIISWQPHGRAFVLHKPNEFVKYVLPRYFGQSKFRSFQRQLNRYGFSRLSSGRDKGGYYHELFLRAKPFLCERMSRTNVKGTEVRRVSSPETEPDFYSMPLVLPNAETKQKATNDVSQMKTLNSSNSFFSETLDQLLSRPSIPCVESTTNSSVDLPKEIDITQADALFEFDPYHLQESCQISISHPIAGMVSNEYSGDEIFDSLLASCSSNEDDCFHYNLVNFSFWLYMLHDEDKSLFHFSEVISHINNLVPDDDPDYRCLLDQLADELNWC